DGSIVQPVFSPDGRWIAYHGSSTSGDALRRISIDGGPPTTIVRTTNPAGMSWDAGGIVYASGGVGENGVFRVSPNGGQPELLVRLDGDHLAWGPHLLSSGDAGLFTLVRRVRPAGVLDFGDAQV